MNICLSAAVVSLIHASCITIYLRDPVGYAKSFADVYHSTMRVFSYVFGCWVVIRIGAFLIYEPTISADGSSIISSLLRMPDSSAVFGFIPEIFEIILVITDSLVEAVFY